MSMRLCTPPSVGCCCALLLLSTMPIPPYISLLYLDCAILVTLCARQRLCAEEGSTKSSVSRPTLCRRRSSSSSRYWKLLLPSLPPAPEAAAAAAALLLADVYAASLRVYSSSYLNSG